MDYIYFVLALGNVVQRSDAVRRPNQQSPFMSGVLERPRARGRRRRQNYEIINQPALHVEADRNANGSFIATTVEDNPQNVIIAVRPETPPPSYCDIVDKK